MNRRTGYEGTLNARGSATSSCSSVSELSRLLNGAATGVKDLEISLTILPSIMASAADGEPTSHGLPVRKAQGNFSLESYERIP